MKHAKLMIPALAMLLGSTAMVGCTNNNPGQKVVKVSAVRILNRKNTVYMNDSTTLELEAKVEPENASNKEVLWSSNNLDVAEVSESGVVTFKKTGNVTITCKSKADETIKADAPITVKEDISEDMTFASINRPAFLTKYESRTAKLDKVANIQTDKDPDRTTFYENELGTRDTYRVGNQNPFKIDFKGYFTSDVPGQLPETYDNPRLTLQFSVKDGPEFVPISPEALPQHLVVGERQKTITFKEGVTGTYRISVDADRTFYTHLGSELQPVVFEVEVIDGYNVYNALDLSVFDNSYREGSTTESYWDSIKTAAGLKEVDAKGIVLQGDIEITAEDLPSEFFIPESFVKQYATDKPADLETFANAKGVSTDEMKAMLTGSMYDYVALYSRNTKAETNFAFEANYFNVDASAVPQVLAFDDTLAIGETYRRAKGPGAEYTSNTNGSHAKLFAVNVDARDQSPWEKIGEESCSGGKVSFRNGKFVANGDYSDEDDKYLGGLIEFKGQATTLDFSNVLSTKTFITFFSDRSRVTTQTAMNIDRCKNFDSYNSLIYVWGTQNNHFTNCFMKGAGGAIILMDEPNAGSEDDPGAVYVPEILAENVYFENYVTGSEPWFAGHSATSAVQMFDAIGSQYGFVGKNAVATGGKSFVNQQQNAVNMIALALCGDHPFDNTKNALRGRLTINNGASTGQLNMSLLKDAPLSNLVGMMAGADQAMLFGSNAGYGAITESSAPFGDGVMFYYPIALMADPDFAAACSTVNTVINNVISTATSQPSDIKFMETFLENLAFLPTFKSSIPGEAFVPCLDSENTTGYIANVAEPVAKQGFIDSLAAVVGQAQAEAVINAAWAYTPDSSVPPLIPAAFQVISAKLGGHASAVRSAFNGVDYLTAYLKPAMGSHYIGALFGMTDDINHHE